MVTPQWVASTATGVFMGGFAGNETSGGAFAEPMGMGRHMDADREHIGHGMDGPMGPGHSNMGGGA